MSAGAKRVVGAGYGIGDWLVQRLTAVAMLAYTAGLLAAIAVIRPTGYAGWIALWQSGFLRVATLLFLVALLYHAWIGVRDIVMDYVKSAGIRLLAETLVVLALAGYLAWSVAILWGR